MPESILQYKKQIEQCFGFALLNVRLKQKNTSLLKGRTMCFIFKKHRSSQTEHTQLPARLAVGTR